MGAYALGERFVLLDGPLRIALGAAGGLAIVVSLLLIRGRVRRLEAIAEQALPGPLDHQPPAAG